MNVTDHHFFHPATRQVHGRALSALFVVLLMFGGVDRLQAQFSFKWMNVGSMSSPYSEAGAVREEEPPGVTNAPVQWPAIDLEPGNTRAGGLWVAATNFTDEDGRTYPVKVAHVGPRSGGEVQFFPKSIEVNSRFEAPEVTVDGARSFRRYVFVDNVDATMKPDRTIVNMNTNRLGVDMEQTISAFSQEFHDNYHIIEYKFTNTGIVDSDQSIEVEQTLNGFYVMFISRYAIHAGSSWTRGGGAPWGKFTMNDAVGDGHEDYDVDFRAQFVWAGLNPDQTAFNTLGGPQWNSTDWSAADDTLGRLAAAQMVGRVTIHADKSVTDRSDDPGQPSTMGVIGSDDPDLVDDEFDENLMIRQYDWMTGVKSASFSQTDPLGGEPDGRLWPHHANQIEPDDDGGYTLGENFTTPTNNPSSFQGVSDEGGWGIIEGYGPYTLAHDESINLMVAEAAAGLSKEAKLDIGQAYKQSGADDTALIEWPEGSGVEMTKNEWAMTARDSLFQTFERAIANYEADFDIPSPPFPPKSFTVTSGTDAITLAWEMFGSGPTVTGFEIWRVAKRYTDDNSYEQVATLGAAADSYSDTEVVRGINYYYYIQAIGETNDDDTGLTPTGVALKSGRYYTQTYLPANLKREAGALSDIHIVPNPFNLGSDEDIRWPDKQDKLGFLDIPGQCTISIYSQLGELIETIEHTDGSGDEFWDHTTSSRQVIASGVYIAVIEDKDTGKTAIKKFVVIR
ncbi:MAG: T9SS type A sorting domain-containing protein [Candidatus Neomarinimicrobiota bacterium]